MMMRRKMDEKDEDEFKTLFILLEATRWVTFPAQTHRKVLLISCVTLCNRILRYLKTHYNNGEKGLIISQFLTKMAELVYSEYLWRRAEYWSKKVHLEAVDCKRITDIVTLSHTPFAILDGLKCLYHDKKELQQIDVSSVVDHDGEKELPLTMDSDLYSSNDQVNHHLYDRGSSSDEEEDEEEEEEEEAEEDGHRSHRRRRQGHRRTGADEIHDDLSLMTAGEDALLVAAFKFILRVANLLDTTTINPGLHRQLCRMYFDPKLTRLFIFGVDHGLDMELYVKDRETLLSIFAYDSNMTEQLVRNSQGSLIHSLAGIFDDTKSFMNQPAPLDSVCRLLIKCCETSNRNFDSFVFQLVGTLTLIMERNPSTVEPIRKLLSFDLHIENFLKSCRGLGWTVMKTSTLMIDFLVYLVSTEGVCSLFTKHLELFLYNTSDDILIVDTLFKYLIHLNGDDQNEIKGKVFALGIQAIGLLLREEEALLTEYIISFISELLYFLDGLAFEENNIEIERGKENNNESSQDRESLALMNWLFQLKGGGGGSQQHADESTKDTSHSIIEDVRKRRRARLSAMFSGMFDDNSKPLSEVDPSSSFQEFSPTFRPSTTILQTAAATSTTVGENNNNNLVFVHHHPPPPTDGTQFLHDHHDDDDDEDDDSDDECNHHHHVAAQLHPSEDDADEEVVSSPTLSAVQSPSQTTAPVTTTTTTTATTATGESMEENFEMELDVTSTEEEDEISTSSLFFEKLLSGKGTISLLPDAQRCVISSSLRPGFRCTTCQHLIMLCTGCVRKCHVTHEIHFEGIFKFDCCCDTETCLSKSPPAANSSFHPTARLLPKLPTSPLIDKQIREKNTMEILLKAIQVLLSRKKYKPQQQDFLIEKGENKFIEVVHNNYGEIGFDMWKGVESHKLVLDHASKAGIQMRRLSCNSKFLAVCEGSFVSFINAGSIICQIQVVGEESLTSAGDGSVSCTTSNGWTLLNQIDLGFAALHIEFNQSNPNLLLVAGLTSCVVLGISDEDGTCKVLRKIILTSVQADLNDCIRRIIWIPNSRSEFCVATGTRLKYFDIFESEKPKRHFKLPEEMCPLVDICCLEEQENEDDEKVILILSSSGCVLRQDVRHGGSFEELLIYEALLSSENKSSTAPVVSQLTPINSHSFFIHYLSGSIAQCILSKNKSSKVKHLFYMEEDEPGSGRAAIGPCLVEGNSILIAPTHRAFRSRGSLMFYEFAFGSSPNFIHQRIQGQPQTTVGRLMGLCAWGGRQNRRILTIHESGAFTVWWYRHADLTLKPVMSSSMNSSPTSTQHQRVNLPNYVFAKLISLAPTSSNSFTSKRYSYSYSPNEYESKFLYSNCLNFVLKQPTFIIKTDPTSSSNSNNIAVTGETDLKQILNRHTSTCLATDMNSLWLTISLCSPIYCIAGLKLHFGLHSTGIPRAVLYENTSQFLTLKNTVPTLDHPTSPIVCEILFSPKEVRQIAILGSVRICLLKNPSSPTISLDGIDVFAVKMDDIDAIYEEFEDNSNSTNPYKLAVESAARLIACNRPSLSKSDDNSTTCLQNFSRTKPELFSQISHILFPDRYERIKVEDLITIRTQLLKPPKEWTLLDFRKLGRAAYRLPFAMDLELKSCIKNDFVNFLENVYTTMMMRFVDTEKNNPIDFLFSFITISLSACRCSNNCSRFIEMLNFIFNEKGDELLSYGLCDALLSVFLTRNNVIRSELITNDEIQQNESDVQYQCDVCFQVPIRNVRWNCKTCGDFDVCDSCFFRSRFDHVFDHSFEQILLSPENFSSSCTQCGDLANGSDSSTVLLCTTCLDSGGGGENSERIHLISGSSSSDLGCSVRDITSLLISLLDTSQTVSISFLRYLISASTVLSQIKFKGNLDYSKELCRILLGYMGELRDEYNGNDDTFYMYSLAFLLRFSPYSSSSGGEETCQILTMTESRLDSLLLQIVHEAFAGYNRTSVMAKQEKRQTIPKWFGTDPVKTHRIWEGISWPKALVTLTDEFATSTTEFGLDDSSAIQPFPPGWESPLTAVFHLLDVMYSKQNYHNTTDRNKSLQNWRDVFCRCFSRPHGPNVGFRLIRVLRHLGSKESPTELIRVAIFQSAILELESFILNNSENYHRENLIAFSTILTRLKKSVSRPNVDRWQKFCSTYVSQKGNTSLSILLDAAKILIKFDLNPGIPLNLILKAIPHDTSELKFTENQIRNLFDWLLDSNPSTRYYSMKLLTICFRDNNKQEWMEMECIQKAFLYKTVQGIEALTLFAIVFAPGNMSSTRTNMDWKSISNKLIDSIRSSVSHLSRFADSTNLASVSFALSGISQFVNPAGKKVDSTTATTATSSNTTTATTTTTTTATTATTTTTTTSSKVNTFSLLYSPPCLQCGTFERSFHLSQLEQIKTDMAYLSTTVIFRLSRAFDFRTVLMDLQTTKRNGGNPLIESVDCFVACDFPQEDVDLTTIALDDHCWEKIATLSEFNSAPSKVSTTTTTSSSNSKPFSSSSFAGGIIQSSSSSNMWGNKTQSESTLFRIATGNLVKFRFNLSKERVEIDRLLCPRCSKPVLSEHGVCANCSEMVYQCRQCRNINYEDLRSFLCVQCGFSRHARFSFRMETRPSSTYPKKIFSEEECAYVKQRLNVISREEKSAISNLDNTRQACLTALSNMNLPLFFNEISSKTLKEAYHHALFVSMEVSALRNRIAEFRSGKLSPPTTTHELRRCFICDYSHCVVSCHALSSILGNPMVLEQVKSNLDLLFETRILLTKLNRVVTDHVLGGGLPKSLEITSTFNGSSSTDPLLQIVFHFPNDEKIMERIFNEMKKNLEMSVNFKIGGGYVESSTLSFLEAVASNSLNSQKVIDSAIELLTWPLNQQNGGESILLACLQGLSRIATSSGGMDNMMKNNKRIRTGSLEMI